MILLLLFLVISPFAQALDGKAGTVDTDEYPGYTQNAHIQGIFGCDKDHVRFVPLKGIQLYLYEEDTFFDKHEADAVTNDEGQFLLKASVYEKMSEPETYVFAAISCDFIRADKQFDGCETLVTGSGGAYKRANFTDHCPPGDSVVIHRSLKTYERPKLGQYDLKCKIQLGLADSLSSTVKSFRNPQTERKQSDSPLPKLNFEGNLPKCQWGHLPYHGEPW